MSPTNTPHPGSPCHIIADMSSPMIGSTPVARVAASLLTLATYLGVVLLPAFLLWLGWQHLTAEITTVLDTVQR